MIFSARNRVCAAPLIVLISWMILSGGAVAQDEQHCQKLKSYAASVLERCGDRLRSFALLLNDIRRTAGSDLHGRFYFFCPIESLCIQQPQISGWFIDGNGWARGARDQKAVLDVLRQGSVWSGILSAPPVLLESQCAIFDVEIAGLAARAACYTLPHANSSVLVVIASEADIGFALVFHRSNFDWEGLRAAVLATVSRFAIVRASGDAALEKWIE
jgi:hypothetical protein